MTTRDQNEVQLTNNDGSAVSQALSVLDNGANSQARQRAVEALGDSSQSVRENKQQVVDRLIQTVLSDPDDDVRAEAINSLYFQGDQYIHDLVTEIADTKQRDSSAVALFSEWLTSTHSEFRMVGATAMSSFTDEVTSELETALGDDDPRVQARAVRAYGELSTDSIEPIRPLLQAENAHVRRAAVSALTSIGNSTALQMLGSLIQTGDEQFRRIAAKHLYQLDQEQSARMLLSALRDPSELVQRTAMVSLIRLFTEGDAVSPSDVCEYVLTTQTFEHDTLAERLHTILDGDHDEHVTVETERSASWLLGELTDRVDDQTVLPWLIDTLYHSDQFVADIAAAYIPQLEVPTIEKELQMLVSDSDTPADVTERAQRVLDRLRQSTVEAVEGRSIEYTYLRYPAEYSQKYQS